MSEDHLSRVLDAAGFYHGAVPTPNVLTADSITSHIAQAAKYRGVIDPDRLGASAIYELAGSPCVYFKRLDQPDPPASELHNLHRMAWNHGAAPLLWAITPAKVVILNCYSRPSASGEDITDKVLGVFETTERGLRDLNASVGRAEFDSGRYWQQEAAQKIDRAQRVDEQLLKDLQAAERRLVQADLPQKVAHALLGRAVFLAYLQDRGILLPEVVRTSFAKKNFLEVLPDKRATYDLFGWARTTFNGDLFPLEHRLENGVVAPEEQLVQVRHLELIQRLIAGENIESGQRSLWPYRFDVIPVELISSIYEMFAHASGSRQARARGTHYTRVGLVEFVLSQVLGVLGPRDHIADIACGSGVFLVEAFRRMVALRVSHGEAPTRQLIRNTLKEQIFGVDVGEHAIRMSVFSLYLTALELDSEPADEHVKFDPLIGRNLFVADAFDESAPFVSAFPFANKKLDAIVGNPPWTRPHKPRGAAQADESETRATQKYVSYAKERGISIGRDSPDQAFLWRAADFLKPGGAVGLIMHANPFFSTDEDAVASKRALLGRFTPRLVANFAELRLEGLFPTSKAPALVLVAEAREPAVSEKFTFLRVQYSPSFKRHGIIDVGPEDYVTLPVRRAREEQDVFKVASWGSARDIALVQNLRGRFLSLEAFVAAHEGRLGQGYQVVAGGKEDEELSEMPSVDSALFRPFIVAVDALEKVGHAEFHRTRDKAIYRAPVVVATRNPTQEDGFRAALSMKDDVAYSEAFYGFAFPRKNANVARYLTAILNSSLAEYFIFMTASVWGIERDEVRISDIARLPVPAFDLEGTRSVLDEFTAVEKALRQKRPASEADLHTLTRQLDRAVFNLYDLDDEDRYLVEDCVKFTISAKMSRLGSVAYKVPHARDLESYAKVVLGVLNALRGTRGSPFIAQVFVTPKSPLQVVHIARQDGASEQVERVPFERLEPLLERIYRELPARIASRVYAHRNLRIYARDSLYIIKPAQGRYWSRSAALVDTDSIVAEHLRPTGWGHD